MKTKAGTFWDPETNEFLNPQETMDSRGRDLIGDDEFGVWWGTENAVWVLSPHPQWFTISGYRYGVPYCAYVRGTAEEARDWALDRRVIDVTVNERA